MCGEWCAWRGRACAALLLLLAVLALAAADLEKRADMSPMPFVMGSRYGRSSPNNQKMIAPRNDRFFMGSRYGKRSEGVWGATPEGEVAEGARGAALAGSDSRDGGAPLVCEFTGVVPFYRCIRHHKRDHYDARSADEAGLGEEE